MMRPRLPSRVRAVPTPNAPPLIVAVNPNHLAVPLALLAPCSSHPCSHPTPSTLVPLCPPSPPSASSAKNERLKTTCKNLEKNISCLFKTAKLEIDRKDAKLDRLHVVLSGSLRVHCHDAKGQECTVGHLQSGDFFGESALLKRDDKDHGFLPLGSTASVTTESECLFIYFEASKMRECLESMPQIAARIDRYIKDRITAQLLAMNLTLFEAMRPAAVALFTSVLEIHTYTRGDAIIVEGECNEFFYVLVSGAVAVDAGEGAKAVHVDLTAKGDYFGEMSLLRHEAAHASVKAAADTTLACIPGESFAALCLSSPEMAAEFEIKALGTKASVGALLCHPRTAPLLKAFLDAEFSSENYHAWDLVEQFRATAYAGGGGDPAKLQADAQAIYGRYFANDAEELINMSAKATRALKKHFDAPPPDGPPSDLFEPAQKCISNNLRGNLQRFCVTPDYKTLLDDFGIYKKAGKK